MNYFKKETEKTGKYLSQGVVISLTKEQKRYLADARWREEKKKIATVCRLNGRSEITCSVQRVSSLCLFTRRLRYHLVIPSGNAIHRGSAIVPLRSKCIRIVVGEG